MTEEEKKDAQINLKEYVYESGQSINVEMPGLMLETLLSLFESIYEDNKHMGLATAYPVKSKEVFNKEGQLETVEIERKEYPTFESFLSQATNQQEFVTGLGGISLELLMFFKQVHLDNIKNKVALKVGTVKTKKPNELKLA